MNHPEATVKLAHQIIERIRADMPANPDPEQLSDRLALEYAEFFDTWTDLESEPVAESCGLVLTALMVAADISSYMAKLHRIAPIVASQLRSERLEESFWKTMKACQLDIMATGNVADAHEALLEWEEVAFRQFLKWAAEAKGSATSEDDETL